MIKTVEEGIEILKRELRRLHEMETRGTDGPLGVSWDMIKGARSGVIVMQSTLGLSDDEFEKIKKEALEKRSKS